LRLARSAVANPTEAIAASDAVVNSVLRAMSGSSRSIVVNGTSKLSFRIGVLHES
jgi:hypothetical protein